MCRTGRHVRYSRITFSLVCLAVCGLLMALWVRSYSTRDKLLIGGSKNQASGIVSVEAHLLIGTFRTNPKPPLHSALAELDAMLAADPTVAMLNQQLMAEQYRLVELSVLVKGGRSKQITKQQRKIAGLQRQIAQYREQASRQYSGLVLSGQRGFGILRRPNVSAICVPHWFPVVLLAMLAAVPWIKWRFSLRALLIGVTIVALVCGALVIGAR